MNINTILKTVFRFYRSLDYQSVNFEDCSDIHHDEYLICDIHALLPFQVRHLVVSGAPITHAITLHCVDTGIETVINDACLQAEFTAVNYTDSLGDVYQIFTYQPTGLCDLDLTEGLYYVKYEAGTLIWYSEYIRVIDFDNTDTFHRIWSDYDERRLSDTTDDRIWNS
jgi:hypothetical protein